MSSERFESLDEEFNNIYISTKRKITDRLPRSYGEEKKTVLRGIEGDLEDARQILQDMDIEARKAPPSYRNDMIHKVRRFRQDLDNLVRDMKRANSSFGGRDELLGRQQDEIERMENSQRAKLIQGTRALERASDSVARSHQIAAETDQIAVDTIDELQTQRESLLRTKDRLSDTDANLSKSRRILNTMARRMMTNKLILAVIILVELAVIGLIVYFRFFAHKKPHPTPTPHPTTH